MTRHSLLLVIGAVAGLVWANLDPGSYARVIHAPLSFNGWIGRDYAHWAAAYGPAHESFQIGDVRWVLTPHYLINDLAMALFFAFAGKEVWEAVSLPNGSLRGRKAATPLVATAGGVVGPAAIYLLLAALVGGGAFDSLAGGWAVPTATDIAFSYLLGRMIFGERHPALRFLLLLAIADDAAGLAILAVFYPSEELALHWLLLSGAAAFGAYAIFNWLPRRLDGNDPLGPRATATRLRFGLLPYMLAGALSWYGFARSGLHPALALLPIIPAIPQAERELGLFHEAEQYLGDLLNRLGRRLRTPVEVILMLFGLANAGIDLAAPSTATALVLAGLLLGKPLGIAAAGWLAARPLGLGLPPGMRLRDLPVLGSTAAVGFTVSLFIAGIAFPPGAVQEAAKMGALLSFLAVPGAILLARLCRVRKQTGAASPTSQSRTGH